jgi:hypothetical protein
MQSRFLDTLRTLTLGFLVAAVWSGAGQAQTWTTLKNKAPFDASTALQLTDGRILVQAYGASQYYTLTPDNTGSYVNGTWTEVASLPSNYGPLYYASAVLPDDRVIVMGGEYNFLSADWTNLGAIYDPVANTWTKVAAPSGWSEIGDAESVVLPNGTFLLASCCHSTPQQATLDASTLAWTVVGTGKADSYDEEAYTLLPSGALLTVDANNTSDPLNFELYLPAKAKWVSGGSTGIQLADPSSHELGPGPLLPNGNVFYIGATGNTAVYTPSATGAGSWVAGPKFPNIGGQLDVADGPAAVLPDGNVLIQASPGVYNPPSYFFEYNGTTLTQVAATSTASGEPSYVGRMLVLPTGQILWTDGSTNVEIYTAAGTYSSAWQPVVKAVAKSLTPGSSYAIQGTLFNGMDAGAYYGDDAQMATNYPLVQIINKATGHVFYARTYGHSSMAVASSATVTTHFAVPTGIETGASSLVVVANGIPSAPVAININ